MKSLHHHHRHFYGTTTLGEKGQVVIPADVRKALNLKSGEKLLVFGMGHNTLTLMKAQQLEKMAEHLSTKLEHFRQIMRAET